MYCPANVIIPGVLSPFHLNRKQFNDRFHFNAFISSGALIYDGARAFLTDKGLCVGILSFMCAPVSIIKRHDSRNTNGSKLTIRWMYTARQTLCRCRKTWQLCKWDNRIDIIGRESYVFGFEFECAEMNWDTFFRHNFEGKWHFNLCNNKVNKLNI